MKYITTKNGGIIIFSGGFTHAEIARKTGEEVRGAGFIKWAREECYGESISLKIPMHEDDTRTLQRQINGY